jgi:hypothetical protein
VRFSNIFLLLSLVFLSQVASAKRIDVKWGAIAGAAKYEYQLSRNESFTGELVRTGTTRNLYFVTELGPGVYFLRVRSLDDADRPGAWSQGSRMVVEAASMTIHKPSVNEVIEVADSQAPFLAEWSAIEGADDYQVHIKRGKVQRTIISPTNSVRVDGLGAGKWELSVAARAAGQVIQKSAEISFNIHINPKPRPVIYSPVSGESVVAWDNFTVRWLNTSTTPKSEVVIRRMGEKTGVISRDIVYGKAETLTPMLAPGAYQITVRNIYENMLSEAAVIEIKVVEDAMGYHAKYFGVSGQLTLGPTFGSTGFLKNTYSPNTISSTGMSGELDFRMMAEFNDKWGLELGVGARGDKFQDNVRNENVVDGSVLVDSSRVQPNAYIGARYKLQPLGPSKPLWIRSWVFWRQIEMPTAGLGDLFVPGSGGGPKFNISNARVFGSGFGAEMRWGGYRSRWDALGRADILVPWVARGAALGTGGVRPFMPSLELRVIPRVKISPEFRLGIVLGGRFETVTLKEKSSAQSKYISRHLYLMPNLSWDL